MIDLEGENLQRLARGKSGTIEEHFGRVRESTLQLQAFAGQAIIAEPEIMVLDAYIASVPGLNSGLPDKEQTFDQCVVHLPIQRNPRTQRQHPLSYLAALDDPSATGLDSQVNSQPYPGFNIATSAYADFGVTNACTYFPDFTGSTYDPRCRLWYQDTIQNGNDGVVFTNPYADADTDELVVTASAPVFNPAGALLVMVGLDMDFEDIEASITELSVTDEEGYAYLLPPGGEGEVAAHRHRPRAKTAVFSRTENEIRYVVAAASAVMAALLLVIGCCTGGSVSGLSKNVTEPVNQLVDVVHSLNRLDFSRKTAGTWMVNDVTSPEVEELMTAFEAMLTVVKFANMKLASGDVDIAQQNYTEAKVLFTKLGNDRGVSIVNDNLGNVYTLQARQLVAKAAGEPDKADAARLMERAEWKFEDAATSYGLAIDDARILCGGQNQLQEEDDDSECGFNNKGGGFAPDGEFKEGQLRLLSGPKSKKGLLALRLQLANRKLNLALCLAAKGNSAVRLGRSPDFNAINNARRLLGECVELAADREDAIGDQRHVECLIEVAKLEQNLGLHLEAAKALDAAESVVFGYHGSGSIGTAASCGDGGGGGSGRVAAAPRGGGTHCVAAGNPAAAVEHWTDAVIACGDRMDVGAVRSSLEGLREQAKQGSTFPDALLLALGFPPEDVMAKRAFGPKLLEGAVDTALEKLDSDARKCENVEGRSAVSVTEVDLCFVMDCTRSMQSWIDQAKTKLIDIIHQAKKDVSNLQLRVSFVGYRDFGDNVQYEGPYDFHTEAEMPELLNKLKHIRAKGGCDVPEDVAGGLKRAIEPSWKSPTRLCILIADAPCHGSIYHNNRDNYPAGCPKKLDPSKLLYTLQYELGVDLYFVRITSLTDKMISVLQNKLAPSRPPGLQEHRAEVHGARPGLQQQSIPRDRG
eukprot:g12888.t1